MLEVWCPGCKSVRSVEISDRPAPHRWGRVRFTRTHVRYDGTTCGSFGEPQLRPVAPIDRAEAFVTLTCGRCVPPWQVLDVQLARPPWSAAPIDTARERYRCPACGGGVCATFHGATQPQSTAAGHLFAPQAHRISNEPAF